MFTLVKISIPYLVSAYFSGSAFLVSLTAQNKQSFTVKSAFKSYDQESNVRSMNKFIALLWSKYSVFCSKQLPSYFGAILELCI